MRLRFRIPPVAFLSPSLGYRPHPLEMGMASLSINLLSLAMSLVTMQVYDRILVYHNIGTLNLLCIGACLAVLIESGLKICRSYMVGWAAAVFEHTVACNAVRHTLVQEPSHTEKLGIGEYLQRISAIGKIRDFYSGQSLSTLIDLPFVLIFLGIIAYLGKTLALVPLLLLLIMGLLAFNLGKHLKIRLQNRDEADDARYDFLIRALSGIHTIKSLGLETLFERRYERWQSDSSRANLDVATLNAAAYDQGVISSHAIMIAVAIVGAPMVLSGSLTLGALVACVMLSGRIMQPLQRALGFWTRLQDIELAHQKLSEHFAGPLLTETHAAKQTEKEGRVELEHVSFFYEGREKLLDDVTLELKPGEAISISGEHGAGKQTLLKLIAGMYPPIEGTVQVNGVEPHLYTSEELVTHVGYLPPDGMIFRGTIADNLSRFGRVPEERVYEMAKLLGLDQEIAMLPAGYETKLEGAHSDAITPGLRQRIAIARVLAAKPRVLLFYNADRALDKTGYNHVYRLLGRLKGRITLVLVTNDQNILQLADKHYQLDQGKLLENESQENNQLHQVHPYQELRL